jgi:hypothetical protein
LRDEKVDLVCATDLTKKEMVSQMSFFFPFKIRVVCLPRRARRSTKVVLRLSRSSSRSFLLMFIYGRSSSTRHVGGQASCSTELGRTDSSGTSLQTSDSLTNGSWRESLPSSHSYVVPTQISVLTLEQSLGDSSGSASGSGQAGSANANTKMTKKKVDCRTLSGALKCSPFEGLTKNQTKETVPSVILGVQGGSGSGRVRLAGGVYRQLC